MLYLYCICRTRDLRPCPPPEPPDGPLGLRWVDAGDLNALAAPAPAASDVASLLAYGQVVAHYHAHLDLVPMRYGSRLEDADAVRAHLRADHDRYEALLETLSDCVELGVRLPLPADAGAGKQASAAGAGVAAAPRSGRDYLLARRARLEVTAAVEAVLEQLDEALAGLYRRRHREQGWFAGERRLSAYYLVPRPSLPAFQRRLAAALQTVAVPGGPQALLTSGPWPPYSFAAADDGSATQEAVFT
ncbi:MAG: GvpL/GvpF family gas vesicle protein [Thiohalocapsa sp.]|jgi:hypothetical protein|uniref:GvpL/GvpF family gas vesicle protein n=1 Tax=Thiohalocapsa sp. TaxID=2497641 RepID=UPI0025FAE723|nr:GvpL/GvpF family gas vesicle protein [Thiohalocapsa sp.]MCG6939866.1 GvpL/GvpF family gas vesicle protein [Thiohalocapsa sp.]